MSESEATSFAGRLARLAHAALDTLQIRLSLLAVEIEQEGIRLGSAIFNLILAALFVGFGVLALAVFVTVALWDSHRLLALGLDVLLFLGLAVWTGNNARCRLSQGSRIFQDSLAELAADKDALKGRR
jgi:uncharacterized membrane protein YqjE